MRLLLELKGHRVGLAEDGPQGLDLALRTRPDVALIDLGPPRFDDYDLARRIHAAPEGSRLRLIAVRGYSQPDDHRRAREAGFESFLVKPVTPQALDEAIAAAAPRLVGSEDAGRSPRREQASVRVVPLADPPLRPPPGRRGPMPQDSHRPPGRWPQPTGVEKKLDGRPERGYNM